MIHQVHIVELEKPYKALGLRDIRYRVIEIDYHDDNGKEWSDPGQIRLHLCDDDDDGRLYQEQVTITVNDLITLVDSVDASLYELSQLDF